MNKTTAFWITAAVGALWIGIGLRDLFAPHLFRFDGRVADNSTVILDFAVGTLFLIAALSFRKAKLRDVQDKS